MRTKDIECRLCGAAAAFRFSRRAADGDEVGCYECGRCRSLQTEFPYWLEQEYARASSNDETPDLDTWAAERTLYHRMVVYFLWKLAGLSKASDKLVDWGGGPGLLARMLRDVGIDAYSYDKYIKNHFASGFSRREGERYNFVTAFEVFEHFAEPRTDIEPIFALQPSSLLISTCVYTNQGPDWPYLGPAKSQHIFFYSADALQLIGRRFGYEVIRLPHEVTLFAREPIARERLALVKLLLANDRLAEVVFASKRKWSLAASDNLAILRLLDQAGADAE
ncbi:hypothetical protein LuPra_03302 [Luteitalea pratensis]|uniref:Methyltransferase domain protein n=1 Tax=Luteitalea pratensis TaxID=1855912 RepID=A0A143PQH9_LUTPR|nr:class I SAM-dependent methyltransferase [Luteitalea pratensis]AMY10074.1 hypothetical protein LuPra_03302 [Luteitalea pratensis]